MKYCNHCGYEASEEDIFCHKCGNKLSEQKTPSQPQGNRAQASQSPPNAARPAAPQTPPPQEPNHVRYVQVNTRTGRITDTAADAKRRSRSDAVMKGMTIAFAAIAVVIVMVAGSMFISGQLAKNRASDSGDDMRSFIPVSSEPIAEVSSVESQETEEPDPVSSEEETVSSVPDDLKADVLRSKIKGKWTTKLPYKGMSLPVTFTFDDAGGCSCSIKALFITKKFDGHYTVNDGGACTITLDGLEEYMSSGNTLAGQVEFVADDELHFTYGNEMLKLNRTE